MSDLANQRVVILGGTSGFGFTTSLALINTTNVAEVIIASSSQARVDSAVGRLRLQSKPRASLIPVEITGEKLDITDPQSVRDLFSKVGVVDHLIISVGDALSFQPFKEIDLEKSKSAFDVRFWGACLAAQRVQIKPEGSITFTIGSVLGKPLPGWSLGAAMAGAVDGIVRALAVDLAPVRVNCVSPGYVNTEMWSAMPKDERDAFFKSKSDVLLTGHVAEPEEITEAYLFAMRCRYLTGKRIEVDGGQFLAGGV